jgi:uncharacterized membrane protein YhiD involved in acid resistance
MTAAIGIAVGLCSLGLALIGTVLTLIILTLERVLEDRAVKAKKEA